MYVQEGETLHMRGIDMHIYYGIAITTHRNINIDFREQANSAPQQI